MPEETTNTGPEGGFDDMPKKPEAQEAPAPTPAAKPKPRIMSNDPALAGTPAAAPVPRAGFGTTGQGHPNFTGEPVQLPSRGLVYPENHPCRSGIIHVRPITTKEEEILATERLQRQGIALDMIMQRCIVTPGIDTMDLVSGDRLMILFYLRAISYGPKYTFEVRMKSGDNQMVTTDVGKLKIRSLEDDFVEPYRVTIDNTVYEMILSRGRHEQDTIRARFRSRQNKNGVEVTPTQTLKNVIISVNGDEDKKTVSDHIDNMVARTAHRLRKAIADINPGPILEEEVINDATGELEKVSVTITETFFRPDLE